MTAMKLSGITFFLVALANSPTIAGDVKYWAPKGAEKDTLYSHSVTCPTDYIFSETDSDVDFISTKLLTESVVFSDTGLVVLAEGAGIVLGDRDHTNYPDCNDTDANNREIVVRSPRPSKWFLAENWSTGDNDNPAKPDMDKIPCASDVIVFNTNVSRVDLQEFPQLYLSAVLIDTLRISPDHFGTFLNTVTGQRMFQDSEETIITKAKRMEPNEYCHPLQNIVVETLCENTKCETAPFCTHPIRPVGFCCELCGAATVLEIDQHTKFDLNRFIKRVWAKIEEMGVDDIEFYAGNIVHGNRIDLQLVVTEDGQYTGRSLKLMEALEKDVLKKIYQRKYSVSYAGLPYNPQHNAHLLGLVFWPLALVLIVLGVAYQCAYNERYQFDWSAVIARWRPGSQFIFAQFENLHDEDESSRIRIMHTALVAVEQAEEVRDDPSVAGAGTAVAEDDMLGLEMAETAANPQLLEKDRIDEVVETIAASTTTDTVNLMSVE